MTNKSLGQIAYEKYYELRDADYSGGGDCKFVSRQWAVMPESIQSAWTTAVQAGIQAASTAKEPADEFEVGLQVYFKDENELSGYGKGIFLAAGSAYAAVILDDGTVQTLKKKLLTSTAPQELIEFQKVVERIENFAGIRIEE